MPKISVIVPVYKVEPYLARCIDSILAQTFPDFELILIDDGSPDNSGKICDQYALRDSRIHVIHQENGGLSAARNAGIDWTIESSDSEWLTFIDSDDWVHPQYLELLLQVATENHTRVSICPYKRVTEYTPAHDRIIMDYNLLTPEDIFIRNFDDIIIACAKLYLKNLFCSVRYPVGRLHEDGYITHTLVFPQRIIPMISTPLYYYFSNPNSISHIPSDKRLLDSLEGQRLRLQFFKENNFIRAYEHELNSTGYIGVELQAMNRKLIPEDRCYRKTLQKRLAATMHKQNLCFNDHIWLYELAYPNLMKCYWLGMAVIRRLKRLLRIKE